MDLQQLINTMNEAASKERANYHLTLGDLIEQLKVADPSHLVVYDFDGASPSSPDSYRGYYCDLSFSPSYTAITVTELLKEASDAVGHEFMGYKGGDYTMDADTPLWASPYGSANGRAIMGIETIDSRVVLTTKQID